MSKKCYVYLTARRRRQDRNFPPYTEHCSGRVEFPGMTRGCPLGSGLRPRQTDQSELPRLNSYLLWVMEKEEMGSQWDRFIEPEIKGGHVKIDNSR